MANDNKEREVNDKIELAVESCNRFGAAVITVSDGHVLLFTRAHLQKLLDANPDKPQVLIHVKHRTFKD